MLPNPQIHSASPSHQQCLALNGLPATSRPVCKLLCFHRKWLRSSLLSNARLRLHGALCSSVHRHRGGCAHLAHKQFLHRISISETKQHSQHKPAVCLHIMSCIMYCTTGIHEVLLSPETAAAVAVPRPLPHGEALRNRTQPETSAANGWSVSDPHPSPHPSSARTNKLGQLKIWQHASATDQL